MSVPVEREAIAPVDAISASTTSLTQQNDAVIAFFWEMAAAIPTHTLQSGWTELFSTAYDEGSTDGRLSVAVRLAPSGGVASYQPYTTNSGGTNYVTGLLVLQAGTFDTTFANWVVGTPFVQTSNSVGDPPAVTLNSSKDWLVLAGEAVRSALGGWTLTQITNYTEKWEYTGSTFLGDLCLNTRAMAAAASENPGTIGDNQAPTGTISYTIGVPNPSGAPPVTLAATIGATSTVAGALKVAKPLAATIGGQSSVSTALKDAKPLAAVIGGVSTVTATMNAAGAAKELAATIVGQTTVAAALATPKRLAAAILDQSTVAAALRTGKPLAAVIASPSTVVAALRTGKPLAAVIASPATVAAALRTGKPLAAVIGAVSTVTATGNVLVGGAVLRLRKLMGYGE